MNRFLTTVGVVAWATAVLAAPIPKDPPPKVDPDKLAKAAAQELFAAMKKKDVDAVMKLLDAPFWLARGEVADKETLEGMIRKGVERGNDATAVTFEIAGVYNASKFGEEEVLGVLRKRPKPDDLQLLAKRIGPDGRVVVMRATDGGKRDERAALFVRVKDGVAKIVGSLD